MNIRVTVKAADADVAIEVKEKFFKKLYEHSGAKVVFEVPDGADADIQEITDFAEGKDCTVTTEHFDDPLDDAEPVSFW